MNWMATLHGLHMDLYYADMNSLVSLLKWAARSVVISRHCSHLHGLAPSAVSALPISTRAGSLGSQSRSALLLSSLDYQSLCSWRLKFYQQRYTHLKLSVGNYKGDNKKWKETVALCTSDGWSLGRGFSSFRPQHGVSVSVVWCYSQRWSFQYQDRWLPMVT